ncbi:Type II secretion system protein I [Bordetella sputigena]|uniref:type II secretion system minor pseudopilin GspI n=1 Tax=Bordetella sputigena TaxID=1416810 RepID=UPI0039EF241D
MNKRGQQQGFSLLEVLVALVIIAIALGACVRAAGQMATSQAALRERALALVSAENTLAQLRAQRLYPPLGRSSEPCPQGPLALTCDISIEATSNRGFRQVTVRVMGADKNLLSELRGLAVAQP